MADLDDSQRISFVQSNPKKAGASVFKSYEKYKRAKTFSEAKSLGASRKDLIFDKGRATQLSLEDTVGTISEYTVSICQLATAWPD